MNLEPARPTAVKQVLICDDESRLASLTAGLLKEFGYESLAVGAGEEALELLRSRPTDVGVLLLDVNLAAGVSAQDILQAMKAEGLSSPVILTSGFAPEDLPDSLRSHDCVASYLPKPYTVTELVSAIKRALQGRPEHG
jgi:DNA-binding NtrC family response regulator